MEKKFDMIIFGASGYTGKYAIREAAKIFKDLNWAIAGRNRKKLENILFEIGKELNIDLNTISIITAEIENEKSIKEMTSQGKVIVNCCGPYSLYGEVVVKSCIDTATNHVDVSGEPHFIENMQLKYNDQAREKGVYIISACGLESIPIEMGIHFMEQHFNGTINSVESYLRIFMRKGFSTSGASVNSGTYFSAICCVANFFEMLRIRRELYPKPLPQLEPKLKNHWIHKQTFGGRQRWCIPLIEPDQSTVMRTQTYRYEIEGKRPIQMNSYIVLNSFLEVMGCMLIGMFVVLMAPLSFTRKLLLKYIRFFTFGVFTNDGPKREKVENTNFETVIIGRGWNKETSIKTTLPINKTMKVKIAGRNPGYGATAIALLLAAKTILNESSKIPDNGGVISPGIAFGKTNLIQELKKNGITFEFID